MKKNDEEFIRLVYERMTGAAEPGYCPEPAVGCVEDEYRAGGECDRLYSEVYDANRRLCERLGAGGGEDRDVECMISNLLDIQKHLCLKMYEYGWLFARQNDKM